jgi:uncharacterized protein
MTVAANDTLNPPDLALEAFEMARGPKELHVVPGGHHAVYHSQFEPVMTRQIEFLSRFL